MLELLSKSFTFASLLLKSFEPWTLSRSTNLTTLPTNRSAVVDDTFSVFPTPSTVSKVLALKLSDHSSPSSKDVKKLPASSTRAEAKVESTDPGTAKVAARAIATIF